MGEKLGLGHCVRAVMSPPAAHAVGVSADGQPRCNQMFHGKEGHDDQVISCAVSGKTLFTGSLDRTIKAWNITEDAPPVYTFKGHLRGIRCVHAEGDKLFSGAGDSMAKMWDARGLGGQERDDGGRPGTCLQTFTGHAAQVMAVKSA